MSTVGVANLEGLMALQWSDSDPALFLATWDTITSELRGITSPETLLGILFNRVRTTRLTDLMISVREFEEAPEESQKKSLKYLLDSIRGHIGRVRASKNRSAYQQQSKFIPPVASVVDTAQVITDCPSWVNTGMCDNRGFCQLRHLSEMRGSIMGGGLQTATPVVQHGSSAGMSGAGSSAGTSHMGGATPHPPGGESRLRSLGPGPGRFASNLKNLPCAFWNEQQEGTNPRGCRHQDDRDCVRAHRVWSAEEKQEWESLRSK